MDGSADSSFNSTGTYPGVVELGGNYPSVTSVALQADGKIVSAGKVDGQVTSDARMIRLEGDAITASAVATRSISASRAAADQFFADLRAVSLLLSNDEFKKH
jgi:hypothetical protein